MRSAWILCLAAMTATASAQPAHDEAEALFRRGKALMARKQHAEACAAFERSHELEPNISALLNHADCREKNAQLATAWRLFAEAERQTRGRADATSKQLNAVATARAGKLEARTSKLSIDVAPHHRLAGLEILRDEDRVEPAAWNQPQPVDGGTYRITARAPGRAAWSAAVTVKPEGDLQRVAIPRLDPAAAAEPPPPPPRTMPALTGGDVPRASTSPAAGGAGKRSLVLPIVMGSTALVLGGTSLAFSRWGDRIYDEAVREPDDARQEALWRSANARRYAAIGLAAGAAGSLGAAAYFYFRGDREEPRRAARRSLRIRPMTRGGALGLSVRGVW